MNNNLRTVELPDTHLYETTILSLVHFQEKRKGQGGSPGQKRRRTQSSSNCDPDVRQLEAEWSTADCRRPGFRWRIMELLTPALLCHNDTPKVEKISPVFYLLLCLYGLRFFPCMEATYHAITTHRKAQNAPSKGHFT